MGIKREEDIDYERRLKKSWKEGEILTQWIGIKSFDNVLGNYLKNKGIYNVAIYGYSRLGVLLQRELINDGICVSYIIDRKGRLLECSLPVYTLEDDLPLVDAIIVSPVELYDEINGLLQQKVDLEIMDLGKIIEEINKSFI